ncbi:hypothetical protein WJ968_28170 [Achromobacter xylosoxidans]
MSMPYSVRNVWTMASVAFGPAASRAGSPGATCEMVKVMASRPATISSMKAERLTMKRSMGRGGPGVPMYSGYRSNSLAMRMGESTKPCT